MKVCPACGRENPERRAFLRRLRDATRGGATSYIREAESLLAESA